MRNSSKNLAFAMGLLAVLLIASAAAAQKPATAPASLASVLDEQHAPVTYLKAVSQAQTGANMTPHPEIYLSGIGRSETWQTSLGDAELRLVGKSRYLRSVILEDCPITAAGVSALANKNLTKIEIRLPDKAPPLGDEALQGWEACAELTELQLGKIAFGENALQTLAALPKLRQLTLNGGSLTPGALAKLRGMRNLTRLELNDVKLGQDGLAELDLPQLAVLTVTGIALTDKDLAAISKHRTLSGLYLGGTTLDDKGLAQLAVLENLTSVSLSGTRVTFDGIAVLGKLKQLKWMEYEGPAVADAPIIPGMQQILADRFGWTFQGACSCGCLDIGPTPKK